MNMQADTATLRQLDQSHHLHPFTDFHDYAEHGGRIVSKAEHIYIYDSEGHKMLDGMSGLWCCNLGYSQQGLIAAALEGVDDEPWEEEVVDREALAGLLVGPIADRMADARRECDELLLAVRSNPGVRGLASNPLLLTILALTVGLTSKAALVILGALATCFGFIMYILLAGCLWGFRFPTIGAIMGMISAMIAIFVTYKIIPKPLSMHPAFWGVAIGFIVAYLCRGLGFKDSEETAQFEAEPVAA